MVRLLAPLLVLVGGCYDFDALSKGGPDGGGGAGGSGGSRISFVKTSQSPITLIDVISSAHPLNLVVGDYNGDHRLDLFTADNGSPSLGQLIGQGGGNFTSRTSALSSVGGLQCGGFAVAIGNF